MQVERLNGFTGPITIQLCERQVQDLDGIEIVETVVPADVKEFNNLVYLRKPCTSAFSITPDPTPGLCDLYRPMGPEADLVGRVREALHDPSLPTVVRLRSLQEAVTARPGKW